MNPVQPHFAILHPGEAVAELGLALAQRFDLAPHEDDARLESLQDVVVVPGSPVDRHHPVGVVSSGRFGGDHAPPPYLRRTASSPGQSGTSRGRVAKSPDR